MTTADAAFPPALINYFAGQEQYRATANAALLAGLTDRERLLVREAAVMGWVQGIRHHDLPIPRESQILATVVDACRSFPDLYPTLTNWQPTEED